MAFAPASSRSAPSIPYVRAILVGGVMFLVTNALQSFWFEHFQFFVFHEAWASALIALVAAIAYSVGHVHRNQKAYKFEHAYTFGSLYFVLLQILHNSTAHPQLPFLHGYVHWAIIAGVAAGLYLVA